MCSICMVENYEMKNEEECNVTTLPCGHKFHLTCIVNCLLTDTYNCPICRGEYFKRLQPAAPQRSSINTLQSAITLIVYVYCFLALLFDFGAGLSMRNISERYTPSSPDFNLTLCQQVSGGEQGLLGLIANALIDVFWLQVQAAMFRAYLVLVVVGRIINFFIHFV